MPEYVVNLRKLEEKEPFVEAMASNKQCDCIPSRPIEPVGVNPNRTVYYNLNEEEVQILRENPAVREVCRFNRGKPARPTPMAYREEGTWSKRPAGDPDRRNWGMLKHYLGEIVQQNNQFWWNQPEQANIARPTMDGELIIPYDGENVDIVIVDGFIDPNHPEFAVNPDGSGGTRVVQYDWFQHNGDIGWTPNWAGTPSTYEYRASGWNLDDEHGMHVASTVAGNTLGWARKANIYNINPYWWQNPNHEGSWDGYDYDINMFLLLRYWHLNKEINPETGRRNPTVMNNSWGWRWNIDYLTFNGVDSITYRGNEIIEPTPRQAFDSKITLRQDIDDAFIVTTDVADARTRGQVYTVFPNYMPDIQEAVRDCLEAGIINVGIAGNESFYLASEDDDDWGNQIVLDGWTEYLHRPPTPNFNGIVVGSINNEQFATIQDDEGRERKAPFSSFGPGVNIWAAGSAILGVLSAEYEGGIEDSRDPNYSQDYYWGTSMAAPQVSGIIACLCSLYQNLTPDEAFALLLQYAQKDALISQDNLFNINNDNYSYVLGLGNDPEIWTAFDILYESNNVGLAYPRVKPVTGVRLPHKRRKTRKSGLAYPRVHKRFGIQ